MATPVKSLVDILSDLVGFQTVSGDHLAAGDCIAYLEHFLGGCGMVLQSYQAGEFRSLVATSRATKEPKLMLQAHLDVVPANGELFVLRKKDGKLYGRGVFDMKFAGAVFLKLADELKNDLETYDFGLMFTFDEEIGGEHGVKALLESGYSAEACLLPDAGDNWKIEETHKGAWIVRLSTKGVAAHGSRPWDGDNAIHRLVDALTEISALFKKQHAETNTLSINQISGGRALNQVADAAEAILDIRFLTNELYEDLRQKIKAIAARHQIKLETVACARCVQTDMSNPYVKSFLQIAADIHGQPLQTSRSLGASDAHYFDQHDIPTILLRPHGGAPHSSDEWIDQASLEKYYELVKQYVKREAKVI